MAERNYGLGSATGSDPFTSFAWTLAVEISIVALSAFSSLAARQAHSAAQIEEVAREIELDLGRFGCTRADVGGHAARPFRPDHAGCFVITNVDARAVDAQSAAHERHGRSTPCPAVTSTSSLSADSSSASPPKSGSALWARRRNERHQENGGRDGHADGAARTGDGLSRV